MPSDDERRRIESAISNLSEFAPQETDGKWLETVTVETAPFIKEWNIERAWHWVDWPDRGRYFEDTTRQDVGIDVVAERRGDGELIAIQCKSRRLDDEWYGMDIPHSEIVKFTSPASSSVFAETWLVTNGVVGLQTGAAQAATMLDKPLHLVNITADLESQLASWEEEDEFCAHCEYPDAVQTKSCMQREAIRKSVGILKRHARAESGGALKGEARGRLILPCGTGKTRISLRIVEELTSPGQVSIVLCPSIALVTQIRREYLQNAKKTIDVLAVCSDQSAGYDPKNEGVRNSAIDPTVDGSNVSANEVKGRVTTDAREIAAWMGRSAKGNAIKVLIGTYQSSIKVSEALLMARVKARVLIADEAHRTAGLKRRVSKSAKVNAQQERIRDFTVCHDSDRFPATHRVYQTATPRIYDVKEGANQNDDWIVRSMDDETTFGVELFRRSYAEAVRNEWLSDYRIIALGVNDQNAHDAANLLAKDTQSKGRNKLSTDRYLKGLAFALAMGGATQGGDVDIRSCIAFMNTVDHSRNMARDLQTDAVREWVTDYLRENAGGGAPSNYRLEHLDASNNAAERETAKMQLARADSANPHAVINVGIFGEGTDSPSLSAVAFLEPRKSPIDVVQAVGRAMRTAPGKKMGYIICPIVFPQNGDPETWLSNSSPDEGWQELGQILLALRAHDQSIEDALGSRLSLYLPPRSEIERSMMAVVLPDGQWEWEPGNEDAPAEIGNISSGRIHFFEYEGEVGNAEEGVDRMLEGESPSDVGAVRIGESEVPYITDEPTQLFTGKKNDDGSSDIRMDTVVRDKPKPNASRGLVNIKRTQAKARKIINGEGGIPVKPGERRKRRTARERAEDNMQELLQLDEFGELGNTISINLLAKSGLRVNRVERDLNILEASVSEAAHHLRSDGLMPALNSHFQLDRLKKTNKKQADGSTIAALLLMNAAMLHQRIHSARWLGRKVKNLADIKNSVDVVNELLTQWSVILSTDFQAVLKPAIDVIFSVKETGKLSGLERALRHIAAEAERIAETYADMGADHAGALFNRVMGSQASDGAYFTRPVAASLAACLTLDACGDVDWSHPDVWREHKTVDLACGSGTLLTAMLSEMKRRAREHGANEKQVAQLQKLAIEDTLWGMDINPVSLQLAASQLTAGNRNVRYRRMGLRIMPYGPDDYDTGNVSAGTLELLGQKDIVSRPNELDINDDAIDSRTVWPDDRDDPELEDAVEAASDARIVIMNPPFTNRENMGQKFTRDFQLRLRSRVDALEDNLTANDPSMADFGDKNSIGPLFAALADKCASATRGLLTMIKPSIALSNPSGVGERRILAERFHIHTILTCHQPGQVNLSQRVAVNESIVVASRCDGDSPPTRFISLDRMPANDEEVADLHLQIQDCEIGTIGNGWGEVSFWPAERMQAGDWTPGIWRSPELAEAGYRFANDPNMQSLKAAGPAPAATGRQLRGSYEPATAGRPGSFPILKSKGTDGQTRIQSQPDEHWIRKGFSLNHLPTAEGAGQDRDPILRKAGNLLITAGQDTKTARMTATADDKPYVGNGWMPVSGLSPAEAKALAVFINSTPGRLLLMRNPGRKLAFPTYSAVSTAAIRVPDFRDERILGILSDCWEQTKHITVPQFGEGECDVRRIWDEAVAEAMGWDPTELGRLRNLLHREPHVRGLGYNQYADA